MNGPTGAIDIDPLVRGCWQFLAVWREQKKLRQGKVINQFEEQSLHGTSAAPQQYPAARLLQFVRDHWSASDNGAHYRRDLSLGEDASQISGCTGAYVMAKWRNLVLGLFELQQQWGKTQVRSFPGWRRQMTNPQKIQRQTKCLCYEPVTLSSSRSWLRRESDRA